jgi:hypothetical protein
MQKGSDKADSFADKSQQPYDQPCELAKNAPLNLSNVRHKKNAKAVANPTRNPVGFFGGRLDIQRRAISASLSSDLSRFLKRPKFSAETCHFLKVFRIH